MMVMRNISICLAFGTFASAAIAQDLNPNPELNAEAKKVLLIARNSLEFWLQDLSQGVFPDAAGIVEEFTSEIYRNEHGGHTKLDDSKTMIEQRMLSEIESHLQGEIETIATRLLSGDSAPCSPGTLVQALQSNLAFSERVDSTKTSFVQQHLPHYYDKIRAVAVQRQLELLDTNAAAPSQEEFETLIESNWNQARLREMQRARRVAVLSVLTERQLSPLAESDSRVRELLQRTVGEARDQADRMQELAEKAISSHDWVTAEQALSAFEASVEKSQQMRQQRSGSNVHIYSLPAALRAHFKRQAFETESERFRNFLERFIANFERETEERVSSQIQSDLEPHRAFDDSRRIWMAELDSEYWELAKGSYVREPLAREWEQKLWSRLDSLAEKDPSVRNAVQQSLTRSVETLLRPIRHELAKHQFEEYVPIIATGTWSVPEDLLYAHITNDEEGLVRPITVSSVEECLELKGVTADRTELSEEPLLEETEELLIQTCNELLEEGCAAWNGQIGKINTWEPKITAEMRKNPAQRPVDGWIEHYTNLISEDWGRSRTGHLWPNMPVPERPSNYATKYVALFDYAITQIRRIVKDVYDMPPLPPKPEEVNPVVITHPTIQPDRTHEEESRTVAGEGEGPAEGDGDGGSGGHGKLGEREGNGGLAGEEPSPEKCDWRILWRCIPAWAYVLAGIVSVFALVGLASVWNRVTGARK